ncbi:MAG: type I-MYXAN CRISPR-associated protein Cas6/Cmx6 [Gammaproteobacteria bacterium]|nr:type I-MYXAN CRISPR-associated protein Cas6/Cmx6 [Gammaproteobacteria bacterium]MBU1446928.1 type I-MYXAN CRISPR-associated protein Cas6/Cmx6 [Gammaproteobacteria bacterium]MDD2929705.1 type I-MYXAN CRISPR-associated protein Cas6/Cmx6 [Sideroxydans sp.]MDD5471548.1 type I-MYXAN CRISPR-associated protein Cas6/Cmx6 [Sideroxydans sp.]
MSAIEISFDLHGESIPADYPHKLWEALLRIAPALAESEAVGVIPLRGPNNNGELLLPKRAKLALRLPLALLDAAHTLSEQELQIGAGTLRLGQGKTREIQPYPTLHAHLVVGPADEVEFMAMVNAALDTLEVRCKLICGRHNTLNIDEQDISGFSLVMHDLTPEDSLRVQYAGMGSGRNLGCGIFVPYKVISGLE